ncbi:MAG: CYTH domain-containing protein [Lachnospiraceae bacterium]|nr:CYTH domain-containing protein [Lachnospiraceae bacterium]
MQNIEIERRFLVRTIPEDLKKNPHKRFEQGYLSTEPVLRVRREGEEYVFTYKGQGLMAREEYNLPLTREAYEHLLPKADGIVIKKIRYFIPEEKGLVIEMDVFEEDLAPLVIAEVEFADEEQARAYSPPAWFGREITEDHAFSNSAMSRQGLPAEWKAAQS